MTTIQLRRDTATNWSTTNPVLSSGEAGYDTTNKLLKIGDGATAWNNLASLPAPSEITELGNELNQLASTVTGLETSKQDAITDLSTIRNGASLGATALQPGANISDLTNDNNYLVNNFSNLSPEGLDKINQSKALETGSVSSNADVYADVLKYKNSGTGTGIDAIKPDNYEVVGTPTITEDGIVSNITSGVSITSPQTYSQVSDFTIVSPEITVSSIVENQPINFCYLGSNVLLSYGNQQWAWMLFYVNNNNVRTVEQNRIQNLTLEFNKKYVYKLQQSYDGTKYTRTLQVYGSEDLSNPIGEYSYESLYPVYEESNPNIKIINSKNNINAEFDLNTCKFYQNGNLVYQPCLKIPYTLSKTGSKIVDAVYRGRVQDVYEQYGVAMYYTLDEENQNFTLPMGEIYGMIEKKDGGSSYTLPTATTSTLGGVKVDGTTITIADDGTLSVGEELANTPDEVQTLSTELDTLKTNVNNFKFWKGTQEEYDGVTAKDPNTLYIITG